MKKYLILIGLAVVLAVTTFCVSTPDAYARTAMRLPANSVITMLPGAPPYPPMPPYTGTTAVNSGRILTLNPCDGQERWVCPYYPTDGVEYEVQSGPEPAGATLVFYDDGTYEKWCPNPNPPPEEVIYERGTYWVDPREE